MKHFVITASILCACILTSCGGGGGISAPENSASGITVTGITEGLSYSSPFEVTVSSPGSSKTKTLVAYLNGFEIKRSTSDSLVCIISPDNLPEGTNVFLAKSIAADRTETKSVSFQSVSETFPSGPGGSGPESKYEQYEINLEYVIEAENQALEDFYFAHASDPIDSSDTDKPSIIITGLYDDTVAFGEINLNVIALDDGGITNLMLLIDGEVVAESDSSSLAFRWDTESAGEGLHRIMVLIRDIGGTIGTFSKDVVVDNISDYEAPKLYLVEVDGSRDKGIAAFKISATDESGIQTLKAQIILDREDGSAPELLTQKVIGEGQMTISTSYSSILNGVINVQATVTDTAGNSRSKSDAFSFDNGTSISGDFYTKLYWKKESEELLEFAMQVRLFEAGLDIDGMWDKGNLLIEEKVNSHEGFYFDDLWHGSYVLEIETDHRIAGYLIHTDDYNKLYINILNNADGYIGGYFNRRTLYYKYKN